MTLPLRCSLPVEHFTSCSRLLFVITRPKSACIQSARSSSDLLCPAWWQSLALNLLVNIYLVNISRFNSALEFFHLVITGNRWMSWYKVILHRDNICYCTAMQAKICLHDNKTGMAFLARASSYNSQVRNTSNLFSTQSRSQPVIVTVREDKMRVLLLSLFLICGAFPSHGRREWIE